MNDGETKNQPVDTTGFPLDLAAIATKSPECFSCPIDYNPHGGWFTSAFSPTTGRISVGADKAHWYEGEPYASERFAEPGSNDGQGARMVMPLCGLASAALIVSTTFTEMSKRGKCLKCVKARQKLGFHVAGY